MNASHAAQGAVLLLSRVSKRVHSPPDVYSKRKSCVLAKVDLLWKLDIIHVYIYPFQYKRRFFLKTGHGVKEDSNTLEHRTSDPCDQCVSARAK